MPTTPTTIPTLPAAPDPADRSTFNSLAYPWSAALNPWTTAVNSAAAATNTNATEAEADAVTATTKAGEAAASASTASTAATTASTAATTASTAATTATTKAGEADASATAAAASAVAASSAASTAASAAAASVSATLTAAVAASATTATNAATSATASATAAANSASSAAAIVLGVSTGHPTIRPSLNLDFANSKTVDPRITFTRASTATYYDGKAFAKAEENLLTYSQEFDNAAWVKGAASVTANSINAPDGTLTGDTLTCVAGTSDHYIQTNVSTAVSVPYTASIRVKAGTHSVIQFLNIGSANFFANFDVGAGTVGTVGSECTAGIVGAGNGWYVCTVSGSSATLAAGWRVAFASSMSMAYGLDFAATGAETIYIWGAQLEQRSTVTAYTPTTTQPITNYIPQLMTAASNAPRIDHDPVTGVCKGLLIEEARTNLLTYSEQFDNAAWTKLDATVKPNAVIAPDGALSADKFLETTSNATRRINSPTISTTAGTAYTLTVYAKAVERSWLRLNGNTAGLVGDAYYNLQTGTLGTVQAGTTASITPAGNGWYRCSFTRTETVNSSATFVICIAFGDASLSYTGDGTSGIYIWGAQLEAGAFPTSYIPTTTAQATRAAENASMTGTNFSSWYRQDEGTFFIENNYNSGSNLVSSNRVALSTRSAGDDRTYLYNDNSTNKYYGKVSGTTSWIAGGAAYTADFVSTAAAYKFNDIATTSEGAAVSTDTSATLPSSQDSVWIGSTGSGSAYLSGYVKRLAYYPKRLSNAELQTITAA